MRRILVALAVAAALLGACSSPDGKTGAGVPASWTQIPPADLNAMLGSRDIVLVNVHVPYDGEIPGTDAFIPYDQIASRVSELPADRSRLVIYCRSGNMSGQAARALVAAGVTGFGELAGGHLAWRSAGLPFTISTPSG